MVPAGKSDRGGGQARSQWRWSFPYAAVAGTLFVGLVVIAVFVEDRIIRPYGGDVLVVAFLYAAARSVLAIRRWKVAGGVVLFAAGIEALQAVDLIGRLGLSENTAARIIFGNTPDFHDIIAYAVGGSLTWGIDTLCARRGSL